MHVRHGHCTDAMPKDLTISLKLPEKTPKDQVARQDPGYRSPEEGVDAK